MSDKPSSSWGATIARWFGLQVASKAIAVALGTPLVTGAVMAGLAYVQGFPLAWGFFTVVGVAAFTSTLLNQARSFLVAYSAWGKMVFSTGEVVWAQSKGGIDGYGVGVKVSNTADIPLEYRMRRLVANIEGNVVRREDPNSLMGGIVGAGIQGLHAIGVAKMDCKPSSQLHGDIEFTVEYGRPGKLNYVAEYKFLVLAATDGSGEVSECRFINQRID